MAEPRQHIRLWSKGFTLAEVLITLAIIGVVAALTIPTLLQSYNKKITETKLLKFYSIMNNAIALSEIDNGDKTLWDYWLTDVILPEGGKLNQSEAIDKKFKKYLEPYLKIAKTTETTDLNNQKRIIYYFSDGSAFSYAYHENRDILFFPQNAEKCIKLADNEGSCYFVFSFYPNGNNNEWKYHLNKGLEPTLFGYDGNPETLYTNCKDSGSYCAALIKNNNWKIPKNYPRKLIY